MLQQVRSTSFVTPLIFVLLSMGLLVPAAKADDRKSAEPAAGLTIEQIGVALDKICPGKNTINNNGQTIYTVTVKRDTWTFHLTVSLSPNGTVLWLEAPIVAIEDAAKANPTALVNLLKKNMELGPTFFEINDNNMLELTCPLANHDLSPERFQNEIEAFMTTIRTTEPQWKKERSKSTRLNSSHSS